MFGDLHASYRTKTTVFLCDEIGARACDLVPILASLWASGPASQIADLSHGASSTRATGASGAFAQSKKSERRVTGPCLCQKSSALACLQCLETRC